jgi:hypothetical protein
MSTISSIDQQDVLVSFHERQSMQDGGAHLDEVGVGRWSMSQGLDDMCSHPVIGQQQVAQSGN